MFRLMMYIRGYLTIRITGGFSERFINACTARNMLLWNIERLSEGGFRCQISVAGFRKIATIAYRTGVRVRIISRHGFPFFLKTYRRRKLVVFGIFPILAFLIIANQFVWDIEVRGNETVKTADILAVLEEEGLKPGVLKSKIKQQDLKNHALIKLPALSWLWVDKQGSRVVVEVREGIPVPEIFDPNTYCHVVAKKSGVVSSMIVRNGIPVVKEGDTVLEGTVLVSGKVVSQLKPENRYLHADAEVYARVWYEKTERFSCLSQLRTATGNRKNRFTLSVFGKKIPLFHNGKEPFKHQDTETRQQDLSFFGKYLGISFIRNVYREVSICEELHTAKSVAQHGAKELQKRIDEETVPDAELLSVSDSYRVIDEQTVEVTVRAEYKENIAQVVSGEGLEP